MDFKLSQMLKLRIIKLKLSRNISPKFAPRLRSTLTHSCNPHSIRSTYVGQEVTAVS